MNKIIKEFLKFSSGLLLAILIFSPNAPVNAQSASSLSVQPSSFHISINSGQKTLQSVLLVNQSSKIETLKIYTEDYKVAENGDIKFYLNTNVDLSAKTWLVPQYTMVTLAPFDSKKIEYIVSADEKMPGGGYDGAIVFQTYNSGLNSYGKPFGALVSVDVLKQGITTGGVIKNFSTPFFQYKDPTKIGFNVKNFGNANLSLTGTISVFNLFGKKISQFDAGQLTVLPFSSRVFNFQWTKSKLFGIYRTEVDLSNLMGKNNSIVASSWLIVFPWPAILISLLGVSAIIFAFVFRKKLFPAKILKLNNQKNWKKLFSAVNSAVNIYKK